MDFPSSAAARLSSEPSLVEFFGELTVGARSGVAEPVGADRSEIAFTVQTAERLEGASMMLRPGSGAKIVSVGLELPAVSSAAVSASEEMDAK